MAQCQAVNLFVRLRRWRHLTEADKTGTKPSVTEGNDRRGWVVKGEERGRKKQKIERKIAQKKAIRLEVNRRERLAVMDEILSRW